MSNPPPPPPVKTTLTIGQVLGHSNQFRIVKLLGKGGFGEVYLAHEERAERFVAIKVMLPEHSQNKKLLRRFKGEYTLGLRVTHPNLVQMFDLAETPDGIHYIVMEYIDGGMLAQRMTEAEKTDGQLGLQAALNIGWQISSLFAQLHERQLIHRDLKPSNIMVEKDPNVHGGERYKLLDFGIAKLTDQEKAKALNVEFETSTGAHMGTIAFMGPEAFKGRGTQGPEGDVYALGCMLYRCFAGNYPFAGQTDHQTIFQHLFEAPIPLSAEDPSIPQDVATLIHKMLAKEPAERPTMAEISAFFAQKLGLASGTASRVVVKGGTQELQEIIGETVNGALTATATGPAALGNGDAQSVQQLGQQVTAPEIKAARRRRRLSLGISAGIVALFAVTMGVVRTIRSPSGQAASVVPSQPTAPVAAASSGTPDLAVSVSVAEPTNTPAMVPVAKPDEKAYSPEKKRKKKKNGLLVND